MKFTERISSVAVKESNYKDVVKIWLHKQLSHFAEKIWLTKIFSNFASPIKRVSTAERWLAVFLIFFPVFLIWLQGWPDLPSGPMDSISAYHEMNNENNLVAFYFPLTAAAMMMVVNGLVKRSNWYNILLGGALAGVVIFNHNDFPALHGICAITFFVGNVFVVYLADTGVFKTNKGESFFDYGLILTIIVSLLLFKPLHIINLFYLEWISLALISLHFIMLSKGKSRDANARIRKT